MVLAKTERILRFRALFRLFLAGALLLTAAGFSVLPRVQAQSPRASHLKTFTSPDGVFRLAYPNGFVLSQGGQSKSYLPVCQENGLACVVYPPARYKGTNFGAAALSVNEVKDATTETACFTFEAQQTVVDSNGQRNQTQEVSDKHPTETINGTEFKTGVTGDAAMSHALATDIYRTFHAGKCYEMDINIMQTSLGVYDPGTVRKFTQRDNRRVRNDLKKVLSSFTFLK
ncbi:MAG TPA: hypothetical protein VJ723_04700 [Candidatus Angelobacter sp.]|nr:hypothetical protein [Candidatus Angelobacter sp.]